MQMERDFKRSVSRSLTCSEGEEEGFVRVLRQQRSDAPAHARVTLVDQLLSEVALDLLRRHLLARRQRRVLEVRHLDANRSDITATL